MKTLSPIALPCAAICLFMITACSKSSQNNNTAPPSPTITSISPTHGPDSTQVTITGTNFSQMQGDNTVYFNGKQAYLLSANENTLVAIVPTLAGSGNVTVNVNGVSATVNATYSTANTFVYDTTWRLAVVADGLNGLSYFAMDPSGNLFIADGVDDLIYKVSSQGAINTFMTGIRASGIALDTANNLYVAVIGSETTIEKISPGGIVDTMATDTGYIYQLTVDNSGNVYAANSTASTVDKITPQGMVSVVARNLYYCSGVAVASDGTLYTTNYTTPAYDEANGVVSKVTQGGVVSTVASFLYDGENSVYLGADGNLYVSNYNQGLELGSVIRVTLSGTVTTLTSANLNFPCGIAMDKTGHIYVVQMQDVPGGTVGSVLKMTMH